MLLCETEGILVGGHASDDDLIAINRWKHVFFVLEVEGRSRPVGSDMWATAKSRILSAKRSPSQIPDAARTGVAVVWRARQVANTWPSLSAGSTRSAFCRLVLEVESLYLGQQALNEPDLSPALPSNVARSGIESSAQSSIVHCVLDWRSGRSRY